jgi:hypothetical protein
LEKSPLPTQDRGKISSNVIWGEKYEKGKRKRQRGKMEEKGRKGKENGRKWKEKRKGEVKG